ncbi:MAG: HAMP domain-containing sensor histidine kinase [Candidatus Zixiibacteriota bacterium]
MAKTAIGTSRKEVNLHAPETLERLAERLTHKIRNPLSVITTAASQLDFSVGQTITDDDLYFTKVILEAAENLEEVLIRYMLYAAPRQPDIIETDINEICLKEFENVTTSFGDDFKNINIKYGNLTPLPMICCDVEMIRLIFREILINSIQELKGNEDGQIIVSTDFDGDNAIIKVEDNGSGVFDEQYAEILLPFITHRAGGTGLGLAVAKSLINLHSGSIEISPNPGGGTIVFAIIPKAKHGEY